MTDGHRHVDRLDHHAALPVQDTEAVRELEDVAEGFQIAIAAAALAIIDVRRSADRSKIDDVAADVHVPRGVAGVQDEARRSLGQERFDDVAPDAHHL
jgi:hypothetical protein